MNLAFSVNIEMESTTCASCGVEFAWPALSIREKRRVGGSFFCPNGHSLTFGKTETDRLREELAAKNLQLSKEREAKWAEERARKRAEAKLRRVDKGVCPDCNRSFANVGRHMKTKHGKKEAPSA